MPSCRDAALAYAIRGWAVFPCLPGSKEPLTPHGFKDATTDAAIITAWWDTTPLANVAIACGASNLVVVDLDVKHGIDGRISWQVLCDALNEPKPETLCVNTPSGGVHLYFCGHAPSAVGFRPGIDIRGDGSYVLAPPSQLATGVYHES